MTATIAEAVDVLRRFTRCPLFGHTGTPTDTRRRIDCADDQCVNPGCVRYVDCDHPAHEAAKVVHAFDSGGGVAS